MTGSISRGRGAADTTLADDVRTGLTAPLPVLPTYCLYDDRGSELFERITEQPEYYQTRTEEALLERVAERVIDACEPRELVELGSGIGRKVRLLLDAMRARDDLERCVLFDINASFLEDSVGRLAEMYPEAMVAGVHGDFLHDLDAIGRGDRRLVLFLAGTIGNLHPDEVPGFLGRVACCLGENSGFLVGVDQVKETRVLDAAYNDEAGVTAEFNRNILNVINRELGADFDPAAWTHVAYYDEDRAWVDIRLRAARDQRVNVPASDLVVEFEEGDEIRTEISAKYTRASLAERVRDTGLRLAEWFEDDEQLFALALLTRTEEAAC